MDWVAGVSFIVAGAAVVLCIGVMLELRASGQRCAEAWFWMFAAAGLMAFVYAVLMIWRLDGADHSVWCSVADYVDLAALLVVYVLPAGMTWIVARANRGDANDR